MRRLIAFLVLLISAYPALAQDPEMLPGLVATYSDARTRVRLIVGSPQFYLEPGESLHPAIQPDFRAEWTGWISIVQGGEYTFSSGAAELSINGTALSGKPVSLTPGRHALAVRYRRTPGIVNVQLRWKSTQFPLEPVPGSILFHERGQEPGSNEGLIERGRDIAEELGCVNCHLSRSSSLQGRAGPDLTRIGSRIAGEWLVKWMEAPWAFRAGAVMPALSGLEDRRDIASYLMSLRAPVLARERKPRGGDVGVGGSLFGSIGCAACHQQPGLSLDGMGSKTTASALAEYLQNPAATDPGGRMPSLMLTAPEAFQLAAYLTDSRKPEFEQPWSGGDAVRGKSLVQSQGCLACHALRDSMDLENRQSAPPLDHLAPGRGCLAPQPGAQVPHYRLGPEQREALAAFLTWYRKHPDVSPAPVYELEMRLRQFRCVACHQLDHVGPTATISEATPPLTAIGAKLRTEWIANVLTKRARVRHWQQLRMPDYDARLVTSMAAALAKTAGVIPGDGQQPPATGATQQTRGAGLIGTDPRQKGMACIGCHDWGSHKSLGEDGPQLINVAHRLRYEWYFRWMLNPARILSGTSMPNYFTSMDRKAAGDIIDTLWAGLSLGERMPLPAGLGKLDVSEDREARPVPDRRPIVVRWDMPEATPAAIAVGMPGQLSYCFDAGESRLRYAWRGGFIDLSQTLTRKTDANRLTPTATLIGQIFYRSESFPLRVGTSEHIPQRRFRGYRLVEGYPEFRYDVDGIEVHERIVPAGKNSGILRQFTIPNVDRPMWFIDSAAGQNVEIQRGAARFEIPIPGGGDAK